MEMTPTPELEAAVVRLTKWLEMLEGMPGIHPQRIADARLVLASLPTGDMASTSAAVTYTQAEFDESYEIGVRDGYESAVQDIDLATGGDGEFRWSSDPDRSIDVPAMKARIIERLSPISETGDMASRDHAPGERSPANPETLELTTALLQGLRRATREQREFIPTRAAILTFFPGADFDEALRRAKGANALLTQASLPTGTGEGEAYTEFQLLTDPESHPVLKAMLDLRMIAASSFTPEFSGQRFEDYDRALLACLNAVRKVLISSLASPSSTRSVK